MRKETLSVILMLFFIEAFSQGVPCTIIDTFQISTDKLHVEKKYIAWYSPSTATHVYGLMFNFWPRDHGYHYQEFPEIYGGELVLNPLGLFIPIMLALHSLHPETHVPPNEDIGLLDFNSFKKIYGFRIALTDSEPSLINGLDINASGSFGTKTNGLTISAVMNKHYIVNGVTIGGIGNHDVECNGLQIGLINSCKELKGLQIGLWNKNQARSFPIINWCFRRK